MKHTLKYPLLILSITTLLAGCQLFTPKYAKPALPVSDSFPLAGSEKSGKHAKDIGWRDYFQNPELQNTIATALANNRDLKIAALRIEETRSLYNIQQADQLPNVNATANASRGRQLLGGSMTEQSTYQVGLGMMAFEIDLFGRLKNLSGAALAQFFATEETRNAVQISLIGEVAKSWLLERALAEQVELAKRTLQARESSHALVTKRFDAGIANALELRQSDTLVQSARVAQLALARQHAQSQNALALLLGNGGKLAPASATLSVQNITANIATGLPSSLIEQRPDIRAAEQRLRSTQASIAAARAAFFPRISLTSGVGLASNDLSELFTGNARTWNFVPQLTLPIFDAGRNKASLNLNQVRSNIAVADYEKTVQVAFREVADALAARATITEEVAAQLAFQQAQSERLTLAQARYKNGIANYLEVLDAERELFAADQQLLQARLLKLTNAVDLYRSLGGGLNEVSK